MSDYQDSITTANKGETIIAGSAACWAKLTQGATALGNQEQKAPLDGGAVLSRSQIAPNEPLHYEQCAEWSAGEEVTFPSNYGRAF